MDYHTYTAAVRLEHQRAAALDRENALVRSIADHGVTISPTRPVVDALRAIGVWFRPAPRAPRLRIAY